MDKVILSYIIAKIFCLINSEHKCFLGTFADWYSYSDDKTLLGNNSLAIHANMKNVGQRKYKKEIKENLIVFFFYLAMVHFIGQTNGKKW